MTSKNKSKRGGSRPGAGRKPTGLPHKKPVSFRLAIDLVEWLATVGNKTATIEAALRAWRWRE